MNGQMTIKGLTGIEKSEMLDRPTDRPTDRYGYWNCFRVSSVYQTLSEIEVASVLRLIGVIGFRVHCIRT